MILEKSRLELFVGNFGKTSLFLKNNQLYYSWNGNLNLLLIPITDDTFILDGMLDFKLRMVIENNSVTGFMRVYEDGQEQFQKKNSN